MHLWQKPHHTDWHTYQKNKSIFDTARWVMRRLLDLARTDNECAGGITENADNTVARGFRQSYIFHTVPKELRLGNDPGRDRDCFFLLRERFDFRWFLVLVAVVHWFLVYGLVLGLHSRCVAGLQGLKLHQRLLWISTCVSGLSTLIIILWFRSSDQAGLESFWLFWERDLWQYLEDNLGGIE